MILGRPIAGDSILGAAGGPIKTVQVYLARMGLPVHATGVLDAATVNAINGIFDGWDDAPPKLRTGRLTKHEIAAQIGLVTRYVKRAATGATSFERLPE
jgi:hypothetical protein